MIIYKRVYGREGILVLKISIGNTALRDKSIGKVKRNISVRGGEVHII